MNTYIMYIQRNRQKKIDRQSEFGKFKNYKNLLK